MNERIRELAEQAGFNPYNYQGSNSALFEKFAELIVKECVATMYKRGETYAHPSAGFYQAKTFAEAVIDHFGVK
jgi:hypothetical protein